MKALAFGVAITAIACSSSSGGATPDAATSDASLDGTTAPDGGADAAPTDSSTMDHAVMVACDTMCSDVGANCSATGQQQYLSSTVVCAAECKTMAAGSLGDMGDTVGCRQAHAALAARDPATHCNDAGPSGGGACGTRCDAFCTLTFAVCITANRGAVNPYASMGACMTACAGFHFDANAPEYDMANHDTLNCRQYHLQAAWNDVAGGSAMNHCPHLGATSSVCNM